MNPTYMHCIVVGALDSIATTVENENRKMPAKLSGTIKADLIIDGIPITYDLTIDGNGKLGEIKKSERPERKPEPKTP